MTVELKLSERLLDMQHRRVNRWSHADQVTVGKAIWALRRLEAITDAWGEIVVADLQVDSWYDNMTAYNKVVRLLDNEEDSIAEGEQR